MNKKDQKKNCRQLYNKFIMTHTQKNNDLTIV